MPLLQLNPTVVLATVADGYLAYNVESNRLHRLNPTAALVVELFDSARAPEQVLAQVAPLVGEDAVAGCAAWIARAAEDGLLVETAETIAPANSSGTELGQLAKRLRRRDRVLAAYVCQRRATEFAPDDADAWYALAELAHITGRRDEARAAYERYQQSHPEDVEIEHLLVALRDEPPPPRAPDHYIKHLYSYFADFYDTNMRGDLDYRAPELLNAALIAATGDRTDLSILELGCGTGLFGELVRPRARWLTGVDLSAEMVERARQRMAGACERMGTGSESDSGNMAKNRGREVPVPLLSQTSDGRPVYDRLEVAEITAWLAAAGLGSEDRSPPAPSRFDAIAVCDTLIYFGDLRQVVPAAARLLTPGGVLGFTVEQGEEYPFRLTDSGRFAHHRDHLREVAGEAGLDVLSQTAEVLRYEYGHPVTGWLTVLQSPIP